MLIVSAGGKATHVNIDRTGGMEIDVTKDTLLTGTSHGKSVLVSNGVTSNITLYDGRYMDVASNWIAYDTTISGNYNITGTRQNVLEGGSAVRTEIKKGVMHVSAGGYAQSASVNGTSATMYVSAQGSADHTTVKK